MSNKKKKRVNTAKRKTRPTKILKNSYYNLPWKKMIGIGVVGGILGGILVTVFNLLNNYIFIPNFIAFLCGGVFSGAILYT